VTFFCYGEDAEEICSTTVKGQEMSVTGTQETQRYTKGNEDKTFVKYRMTWFTRGRKPYVGDRNQSQPRDNGGNQGYGRNDAPQQVAPRGGYPSRSSEPQGNGDGRYSNSGYGRIDAPPQGAPRGGNPRRGAEPEGAGEGFGSSEHGHFDDGGGSQPFM